MSIRGLLALLLVPFLFSLTGCDPEILVKRKVPDQLQQILSFDEGSQKTTQKKAGKPRIDRPFVKIVSPVKGRLYQTEREIIFQAKAHLKGGDKPDHDRLRWQLFSGTAKKPKGIGQGFRRTKLLKPGKYRVKLVFLVSKKPQKGKKKKKKAQWNVITHEVPFTVGYTISGTIATSGRGVKDVSVELTDLQGKRSLARTKSNNKGHYSLPFPQDEYCRLTAVKPRFSFSPLMKILKFHGKSVKVDFRGARAAVSGVKLTSAPDSNEALKNVCPKEKVYLKMAVNSKRPAQRFEVNLVQPREIESTRVLLGEGTDGSQVPNTGNPKAPQYMEITVPTPPKTADPDTGYRLTVTFYDADGNSFAAAARHDVRLDIGECILHKLREGASLQEAGKYAKAVKQYLAAMKLHQNLPDLSLHAGPMEKVYFNAGLAYLGLAIDGKVKSIERTGYLARAVSSFTNVLKYHKNDVDAFLLRGLARYLNGRYESALDDYSAAIRLAPRTALTFGLRARAYLESRRRAYLPLAIDDLTEAITMDPNAKTLRQVRRKILELDLKLEGKDDSDRVNVSSVPLPAIASTLDLRRFIRK